jgi:hypothetical protein
MKAPESILFHRFLSFAELAISGCSNLKRKQTLHTVHNPNGQFHKQHNKGSVKGQHCFRLILEVILIHEAEMSRSLKGNVMLKVSDSQRILHHYYL